MQAQAYSKCQNHCQEIL